MYILAVNGSPRGPRSNTDRILQPFLRGAREAGAETETIYLRDLEIVPCLGCFTCWTRTPGVCVHKDDMPEMLVKLRRSDLVVYATPLYVFTVTGIMKNFMDRHIPNLDPHIVKRGDHYTHPPRYPDASDRRLVLISNCGFPERHHFDGLVETFKQMAQSPDSELVATILCTSGELLKQPSFQDNFDWYLHAAQQAGREIVEQGSVRAETQALLDRDLTDPETMSRMANAHWDSMVSGPEQPVESKPPPSGTPLAPPTTPPNTLREVLAGMPTVFNARAAGDLRAVLQFHVTGDEPGDYYLQIADGTCSFHQGQADQPTTTITTPSDVWLAVARGEIGGGGAMMQGLYRVSGDFGLMMQMEALFSGQDAAPAAANVPAGPLKIRGMAWLSIAFVPWIAHSVLSAFGLNPLWSAVLPLLLSALIWLYRRAYINPTWLDTCSPLFFLAAGLLQWLAPGFWAPFGSIVGNLVMSSIWMGTLATDKPLTAEYSRWNYPPGMAQDALFIKINAILTVFWAAVFVLQAILGLAEIADPARKTVWMVVHYLALVPAFWFTSWFPKWYPAHVAAGGRSAPGSRDAAPQ